MVFEHVTLRKTPIGLRLDAIVTHTELPNGGKFTWFGKNGINAILCGKACECSCTREFAHKYGLD